MRTLSLSRPLSLIIATFLLCACTPPVKPDPVVVVPADKQVNIDARLRKACSALPPLTQPSYTEAETVQKAVEPWIKQYTECADRHAQLVKIVDQAFNLKPLTAAPEASK